MSVTLDTSITARHVESAAEESTELEALIRSAIDGDRRAWDHLYQRFQPLISRVCRRYGLSPSDAGDVSQTVWMQLVRHLTRVREPRSLPGWLATTAKHECLAIVRGRRSTEPVDPTADSRLDQVDTTAVDDHLDHLDHLDRHRSLHEGLSQLRPHQRDLVLLLLVEPKLSYLEISDRLGIPVGSIGPTRARCLQNLRLMMAS